MSEMPIENETNLETTSELSTVTETVTESGPVMEKKNETKNKKKLIILLVIGLVFCIFCYATNGFHITKEQKDEHIAKTYLTEGYEAADKLIEKYYGTSEEATVWRLAILKDMVDDLGYNSLESRESTAKKKLKKVEQNLNEKGNYFYYDLTLRNDSEETLDYIKIDIFLMDSKDNIIQTEWTNWSGTLPPNASTRIDTMFKYVPNVAKYRFEVDEVSIK